MRKVLFSVIVPIYGVESYLPQCIESIINQTYKNIEIILVDDGSVDGCSSICDEYAKKDNRIRVIHKQNGGLTSARKAGLEVSMGDYIVPVDGDDWVAQNYLELFYNVIMINKPDMIVCGRINVKDKLYECRKPSIRNGYYSKKEIVNELFPLLIQNSQCRCIPYTCWGKAYKRELYYSAQMAVDNRIFLGEDIAIVTPCYYNANSIYVIDECTYYYRVTSSSYTHRKPIYPLNNPELRCKYLESQINMQEYDFQDQLYRAIVHYLFNVIESQFNSTDSYFVVKRKVNAVLKNAYYKDAILKAHFRSYKGIVAKYALMLHLYCLIFVYSKIPRAKE